MKQEEGNVVFFLKRGLETKTDNISTGSVK